jgi:hypothetical protein
MTTNGDRGRVVEHREGVVGASNPRGVKLAGEPDYRNFSKYADPPITPPHRGTAVRLGLDSDGYIRTLEVLAEGSPSAGGQNPDRDAQIRRQVAMKCAVQLTAAAIESNADARADWAFPLAEKILAWLEQGVTS